jgi:hypothetical protein
MFPISRLFGAVLLSLALFAGTTFAVTVSSLEGVVRDPSGHVVKNADVKIEAKDGSNVAKVVQTDAKGFYACHGLTAGKEYRVTLLVGGTVRASISNVKATPNLPTQQLNFALKKDTVSKAAAAGKKKSHMVYVPTQTGSNMGGRWVEVDETTSDTAAIMANANRVERASGAALSKSQGGAGGARSGGGY